MNEYREHFNHKLIQLEETKQRKHNNKLEIDIIHYFENLINCVIENFR